MSGGEGRPLVVGTPEYEEWLRGWVAERRPRFEADAGLRERAARLAAAAAEADAAREELEELERRVGELEASIDPDARALAALDPTFRSYCPPLAPDQADELAEAYGEAPPDTDDDEGPDE